MRLPQAAIVEGCEDKSASFGFNWVFQYWTGIELISIGSAEGRYTLVTHLK